MLAGRTGRIVPPYHPGDDADRDALVVRYHDTVERNEPRQTADDGDESLTGTPRNDFLRAWL